MGTYERMLGGRDKRKEWKDARKPEISEYNKSYYQNNYENIQARRKIQRVGNRKNAILGF